jgi:putative flippase GtrA
MHCAWTYTHGNISNIMTFSGIFQFSSFVAVGFTVTVFDFLVFNLLTGKRLNMPRIPANLISASMGMTLSFICNYFLVFEHNSGALMLRIGAFLATNAVSMYVIQSGVLWLLLHRFPFPAMRLSRVICTRFDLNGRADFCRRNIVKSVATLSSMLFNYSSYALWVFG